MRISCVLGPFLPVPPIKGGAVERVWHNLCTEFARMGHDVTLVSRRFADFPASERKDGVRFLRVKSTDAPRSRLLYRAFDVAYAARVCAALPASDITVTNSVSLPLLLPRRTAGMIYVSVARFPKGQMSMYGRAARLQAVSSAVAEAMKRQSPGIADRVKVIPNALSRTFAELRSRARGRRDKEILYVGRIAREKGIHLLVRAFLQIAGRDEWHLSVVGPAHASAGGDGAAYLAELKSLAAPAGPRIRFEGPIYGEAELVHRMRSAEIFAYPSLSDTGESFGMAPLEAMSCGCAVVVSDLDCFRDFAADGENAVVFVRSDAGGSSLARALTALMDDGDARRRLAEAAIRTAEQFDPCRVAQSFIDDFDALMADRDG
jgi:glycosyltransferase involved in cell wall biosynthesis